MVETRATWQPIAVTLCRRLAGLLKAWLPPSRIQMWRCRREVTGVKIQVRRYWSAFFAISYRSNFCAQLEGLLCVSGKSFGDASISHSSQNPLDAVLPGLSSDLVEGCREKSELSPLYSTVALSKERKQDTTSVQWPYKITNE